MEGDGRGGQIGGKQTKRTLKRDKEKAVRAGGLGNVVARSAGRGRKRERKRKREQRKEINGNREKGSSRTTKKAPVKDRGRRTSTVEGVGPTA